MTQKEKTHIFETMREHQKVIDGTSIVSDKKACARARFNELYGLLMHCKLVKEWKAYEAVHRKADT